MTKNEEALRAMLSRAQAEIHQMRESINILSAQMRIVEIFGAASGFSSRSDRLPMAPDICWEIHKLLEETKPKEAANPVE